MAKSSGSRTGVSRYGRNLRKVWQANDYQLDKSVPRGHRFTFFRVGVDVCAKCRKPRKDHE